MLILLYSILYNYIFNIIRPIILLNTTLRTSGLPVAIGCSTYISTATRPDISVAVSILSSYMSDPSKEHWSGVKRLLRYIKGTLNFGLKYSASESNEENEDGDELYGYSDANWAGDVDSRRSTSGY